MALPEVGALQTMSSSEQVFGRAWAYGGARSKSAAEFWRDYSKGLTHEQRLAQVRFIARMMDDQFWCLAPICALASTSCSACSPASATP
jgi:hypothetical protein